MIVDDVQHTLKGTITLVPGDNLASQCLGGYKSLASALRKCRQCMAVNEDMQTKVSVCVCVCVTSSFKHTTLCAPCICI